MNKNKLILFLFIFLFACSQKQFSDENIKIEKRILFIGNSITYTNNLPALINVFSHKYMNTNYISDMLAFGGATVSDHIKDKNLLNSLLSKHHYDYLVLQERGGDVLCLPYGLSDKNCQKVYDSHMAISNIAKKYNIQLIYLGTYQFKEEVSQALVASEKYISKEISASYIEISESLRKLQLKIPELEWLNEDKGHPGKALTFLMGMKILMVTEGNLPHIKSDICTNYTLYSPTLKHNKLIRNDELLKRPNLETCWLSNNSANNIIEFVNQN